MIQFLWMLLCLTDMRYLVEGKRSNVELIAILGANVTLHVLITDGLNIKEIIWYFNSSAIVIKSPGYESVRNTPSKARLAVIDQNGSLQISHLSIKDKGLYKLEIEADNEEKSIILYTLKIFPRVSKPHITVTADSVNGTCNITLNCTAQEGGDNVNYTWNGGNINQSVGSILDLSWTNSSKNVTVDCTAANPVSNKSASIKPWESCKQEFIKSTGDDNNGKIAGIVSAVIVACVAGCAAVACRKKRKKMEVSRNEGPTTYSQINSPSNTTQGSNHYTKSEETKSVTTVYATVNTRKRESPAINDCAPEENTERTMYTVVQTPKKRTPAANISAMDEKTVYSEVQLPKNKIDDIILYETVSNDPSQATSYN